MFHDMKLIVGRVRLKPDIKSLSGIIDSSTLYTNTYSGGLSCVCPLGKFSYNSLRPVIYGTGSCIILYNFTLPICSSMLVDNRLINLSTIISHSYTTFFDLKDTIQFIYLLRGRKEGKE